MKSFSIMALTNVRSFVEFHPHSKFDAKRKRKAKKP